MKLPHPFPYQGSKRNLAPRILDFFPSNIQNVYEPFCGAGAVSIAAAAVGHGNTFYLNDLNGPLMELWNRILNDPDQLSRDYKSLWEAQHEDRKQFFLDVRERFNETKEAHHLLYLLARIVKGAVRYSGEGKFNQSPDNRRSGMKPTNMRAQLLGVSALLSGKTETSSLDFGDAIANATDLDLVYMDPPYQGTSFTRDQRYLNGLAYDDFVSILENLNTRGISYIISYDGRTGDKSYGKALPSHLLLEHHHIHAGRSSQATLLGRKDDTVESLYISKSLVERLARKQPAVQPMQRELAIA